MAKNLIQDGDVFDHTITSGESAVASGEVVVEGGLIGVAVTAGTYANSDVVSVNLKGVYLLDKTTSLVITKGDKVFYNTSTKKITKTITDKFIGYAWTSELTNATTVQVKLSADSNGAVSQAAVVAALGTTTNLTAIAGSYADLAAARTSVNTLAGEVETRLDAIEAKVDAVIAALKTAGLMATS